VYIITTGGRRLARNTRPPMAAPASTVPPKQQSTRRGNQRNGGNVCPSNFPPSDVLLKSKSSRLGKQLVPHVCRRPSITAGPAPFGIATINPAAATTECRVATRGRDGNRVLASPSRGGESSLLEQAVGKGQALNLPILPLGGFARRDGISPSRAPRFCHQGPSATTQRGSAATDPRPHVCPTREQRYRRSWVA
jgi:hypothetical protein